MQSTHTGANTGIGLALTKQLVSEHNCHVYLGSRDAERGAKAVEDVKKTAGGSVELLTIVSIIVVLFIYFIVYECVRTSCYFFRGVNVGYGCVRACIISRYPENIQEETGI